MLAKEGAKPKQESSSSFQAILDNELVLKKIFQYLPSMKGVNLVCKQFYEVACEIREGKDWMRIRTVEDVSHHFF